MGYRNMCFIPFLVLTIYCMTTIAAILDKRSFTHTCYIKIYTATAVLHTSWRVWPAWWFWLTKNSSLYTSLCACGQLLWPVCISACTLAWAVFSLQGWYGWVIVWCNCIQTFAGCCPANSVCVPCVYNIHKYKFLNRPANHSMLSQVNTSLVY